MWRAGGCQVCLLVVSLLLLLKKDEECRAIVTDRAHVTCALAGVSTTPGQEALGLVTHTLINPSTSGSSIALLEEQSHAVRCGNTGSSTGSTALLHIFRDVLIAILSFSCISSLRVV